MEYTLAIDQSTTATKALLFSADGHLLCRADRKHRQITTAEGWIEHDAEEILANTLAACRELVEKAGVDLRDIRALGLTNQRETVVCWDRRSGRPLYNAIVWQCPRAATIAERLRPEAERIRAVTGLQLSPYFSAPKAAWLMENAQLPNVSDLCVGTMDSWLLYSLTREHTFATDCSNASRTMLLNLSTMDWDEGLIGLFGLRRDRLPQIMDSDACFGHTTLAGLLPEAIPVYAVLGDSHAALLAHSGLRASAVKATFGTGTSVMLNVGGSRPKDVPQGVVASVGWRIAGRTDYVLEGNINYSGAIASWLRDNLKLIEHVGQAGELAASVPDSGGVYFVPAFSGLGAPYWNDAARAMLSGMHTGTTRAHVVRAAEEAIAYQIRDILAAMRQPFASLYADGGATRDAFLMQFLADMLQTEVLISETGELSAAGAAYLASVRTGLSDWRTIEKSVRHRALRPAMSAERADELHAGWRRALDMLIK